MGLNYANLRNLTAREIMAALVRDGFYLRSSGGSSHQRYQHADGRRVTVSFHRSSGTFPPKTLRDMLEYQAKWTEIDLVRLGLLKR
jgi:predicted RNA binding protein YcfA (HicA-like mRNA interferase family)